MFGSMEIILILYFFFKTKKYLKDFFNNSERLGNFFKIESEQFFYKMFNKKLKKNIILSSARSQ